MPRYCRFDPKTGIKRYETKAICDYASSRQVMAWLVDAAPKVIKRIDDTAYQTEIAETEFIMANLQPKVYYNCLFPELHAKLKRILHDNPNHEKWGPEGIDLARHNLGLYNDRVVMLDFY